MNTRNNTNKFHQKSVSNQKNQWDTNKIESNSTCVVYLSIKKNNVFVNVTDIKGQTIIKFSSGLIQKNKSKKQLPSIIKWIFEKLSYFVKNNFNHVKLIIKAPRTKSFFYLRELKRKRLPIIYFENRIPLAHNGCRSPKKRRI